MKVSAQRPGGSWLEQNYDKLALVLSLVLLLSSSVFLLHRVGAQRRLFNDRFGREAGIVGRAAQPLDLSVATQTLARIESPFQAQPEGRRFLISDLRVASIPDGAPIPFAAARDPFSGKEQPPVDVDPDSDGDGIPDKFETSWGLNAFDPLDASSDLDGDGFSNLEEYQAGTDPIDPASLPPPAAKLRLVRTVLDPFRFIFVGISGEHFQLNTRTGDRTYFVSLGDEVEGFKVVSYDSDAPSGPTLVLQRGTQSFKLVRGRPSTDESRTAFLVFLVDGSRYRVRLNDTLSFKDINYKVVDIRQDRVVIRNTANDKLASIVLISPEERSRLSGGAPGALETPPIGL